MRALSVHTCVVMSYLASVILLLLVVTVQANHFQVFGPERVQEFHSCVGSSTYIPWPLNVISRMGHKSTKIFLTFQRRHSEASTVIATFSGQQELTVDNHFKNRMSVSNENSGIFLQQTSMDDAGTYSAQARFSNGQVWTRTINLTVLLRPIVVGGHLNISKAEIINHGSSRSHCVNLTCGKLEFAGHPPVSYMWTTTSKTLAMTSAADNSGSSLLVCPPFFGNVTCSIAGFSSICMYDHVVSVHLDLPETHSNRSSISKAMGSQDLALTIIMPILAVLVPLAILGVWVLSHILKSYPQYREQRHFGDQEPQVEIDIEENGITEHTHDNDGQSEEENEQSQTKDDLVIEENLHNVVGNNNILHQHDAVGEVNAAGDDNIEDEEGKTNENKPLMNTSVSTTV